MNVIHVIGNYLLIFGHLGFPELGVEGAAISTVVSKLISLFIFFWLLYRLMEVKIAVRDYFSFSMEYIKKSCGSAFPPRLSR